MTNKIKFSSVKNLLKSEWGRSEAKIHGLFLLWKTINQIIAYKVRLCPIDEQRLISLEDDPCFRQIGLMHRRRQQQSVLCFHCQDNELRDYRVQAAVPHDHSDDEHSPEE